jgi:hypothetical protein
MKFIFLIAMAAALLPVSLRAQQPANTSVCLSATPPGVLLNICQHARGMVTLPQPTLYLRVYTDGRGEYETSNSENVLVRKEFRINEEDLGEIAKLGAAEGVQKALEKYPAYNHGTDSSREITVEIYTEAGRKKIILTNFFAADRENKNHYPASLISLMEKMEELWARTHGMVVEPQSITFCTLMADREYLTGKHVRIWADMELGIEQVPYLHDPECDRREVGKARTSEHIGFSYDEKKLGKGASVRDILRKKGFETYPRVRVFIEGVLRKESEGESHDYPYRFVIERFLNVDKIVAPYVGELKEGWTYSDTIDHVKGKPFKLSSPLKPMIHHAQLIEWTNEDKFPALRLSGRKYFTFRVISKETRQMERSRWNDVYTCELIEITEG